jgi:hypothetical protein
MQGETRSLALHLGRTQNVNETERQSRTGHKEKAARRLPGRPVCHANETLNQAAFNHIAVSNALHIIGMFIPKLAFEEFLFLGLSPACWATSVARSHDPFSWERATEKNKNT